MIKFILLAFGGALGAVLRYVFSGWSYNFSDGSMPWGTIVVNITGSLCIGICTGVFEKVVISPNMRILLFIGILGAFTTFSTYSIESFNLIREGEFKLALVNIVLTNIVGISMACIGFLLVRYLFSIGR